MNIVIMFALIIVILLLGFIVFMYSRNKSDDIQFKQSISEISDLIKSSKSKQDAIESIISNHNSIFSQRLDNINQTVGQRLDNAHTAVKGLEVKMEKVESTASKLLEIGKDISSLQQILKAPKLRGGVGEQLLENLLADMVAGYYQMEYSFKNGERVDAIIKTPQGIVPIDSKFPIESFQRLASETNEQEIVRKRKEFHRDVKAHADKIAKKYIRPEEGTFNFAMMYVPAENIYYEIISIRNNEDAPSNYAISKNVIPVSPTTFYAYLHTILMGLKGMRIETKAREILDHVNNIRVVFHNFQEDFDKIGKHISNASNAFESARKKADKLDNNLTMLDNPDIKLVETVKAETSDS